MVLTEEREPAQVDGSWQPIGLNVAATLSPAAVLHELGSTPRGLTSEEASRRLAMVGPNALRSHGARVAEVFVRQLHNPLLILLVVTAAASAVVGEGTDAAIIMTIICLSVGLGFFNEYRSARAVEELHSRIRSTALAFRDANATPVDVTQAVPGDVVQLSVGDVFRQMSGCFGRMGWNATNRCSPASRWPRRSRWIRFSRRTLRWPR